MKWGLARGSERKRFRVPYAPSLDGLRAGGGALDGEPRIGPHGGAHARVVARHSVLGVAVRVGKHAHLTHRRIPVPPVQAQRLRLLLLLEHRVCAHRLQVWERVGRADRQDQLLPGGPPLGLGRYACSCGARRGSEGRDCGEARGSGDG